MLLPSSSASPLAENSAIDRIATAAESVCRHNEISKIALIKMTDDVSALVDAITGKGIEVHVIEAESSFNEEDLVNEKDGVIAVGNNTRAADLSAVTRTCRDYDIDILGNHQVNNVNSCDVRCACIVV